MNEISFVKMNGAGNDFVVIDGRDSPPDPSPELIRFLCDRHRGVGADGVLIVRPPEGDGDFRMRYYNSDGGEAKMCGNGARCFARFCASLVENSPPIIRFETRAGLLSAELFDDGTAEIAMSEPHSLAGPIRIETEGTALDVHFLDTGVPHAVAFLPDEPSLAGLDVEQIGRAIRNHPHFAPAGTNANFATPIPISSSLPSRDKTNGCSRLAVRTYERGVEAETLACGTGATACALLHHVLHGATSPVETLVKGGDTLRISFDVKNGTTFSRVLLRGPADFAFRGTVKPPVGF